MIGPLSATLHLGPTTELVIATFIGMGFGFSLERGGFGRADNLTAIFYGRDFRVLRVMFTAIVTAALGLYFLDLFRIVPIHTIGILETYWVPQLLGGLMLGAGFIIGGYCPGTSLVAFVSGKIDALLFLVGLLLGSMVFTLSFDAVSPLQQMGYMGRKLLHEVLHIPSGVMVFLVVLMAIGAFSLVAKIEAKVNGRIS
jgi:hypothetical protein